MQAKSTSRGVSVMIFTLNEAIHLPSCLASLTWCDDVIVVDSFSTDETEAIARAAGARFFQRKFDGFGSQRNWALEATSPKHEWILILDADERVTPELATELQSIAARTPDSIGGYRLRRRFHMWGRWLRHSSLYPTWVLRLLRRGRVQYVNRGHAETQHVEGDIGELEHDLIDENLKGFEAWLQRQVKYAVQDARYEVELESGQAPLGKDLISAEPLVRRAALKRLASRLPARGLVYFAYAYGVRGGWRDGRDGLVFCGMRGLHQQMVEFARYDLERTSDPR